MAVQSSLLSLRPMSENKYLWLLLALIGFIVLIPLYREFRFSGESYVLDVLLLAVMVLGVRATCDHRPTRLLGTCLWILAFALSVGAHVTGKAQPEPNLLLASRLLFIGASSMLTALIVRDVFTGKVTRDQLRGAACAYLMMGVAFGLVFTVIEQLAPGSFQISGAIIQEAEKLMAQDAKVLRATYLNYYSFVTLSTLGYGDISPVRPFAQSVAYLCACIGQFYLTVLVAFLVGMRLAHVAAGQHDETKGQISN